MLRVSKPFKKTASMEAFTHQSDLRFRKLANIFSEIQVALMSDEYRSLKTNAKLEIGKQLLEKADIETYLMKSFGIKAALNFMSHDIAYASVATMINNTNSSMLEAWRKPYLNSSELRKQYAMNKSNYKKNIALVDRKNARVSGVLSDMTQKFNFASWWMLSDNCSPEEAAAVFLHEVGHVLSFYELALSETYKNELMNSFRQLKDPAAKDELKYTIIPEIYKNDEGLLKFVENDESVEVLMETELSNDVRNEIGDRIYSERGWEQLADDFASKLGAAPYLHSALDKISDDPEYKRSTPTYLVLQVCNIIAMGSALILAPLLGYVVLVLRFASGDTRTTSTEYDRVDKRLARLRQESVGRIRSGILTKEEQKTLLGQIENMKKAEAEYNIKRSFFDVLTSFGGLRGRRLNNIRKEQALLEELVNNELHTLTAKLNQYGE